MLAKPHQFIKKHWYYFFFIIAALWTIYMNAYICKNILDSDASIMMYRGYLLATEGISGLADVRGMNEIRLFDSSLFFAPFFKLFSNWTMVRFCGTALMQALYVMSFFYLLTQLKLSKQTKWVMAGVLLLPFSSTYARIVLYHLHYCIYISFMFLLLALFFKLLSLDAGNTRQRIIYLIIFGLTWIIVGLNGIRHFMILLLPLLTVSLIHMYQLLRECTFVNGRLCGKLPHQKQPEMRMVYLLIFSCIFFFIGFIVNKAFLAPFFHAMDFDTVTLNVAESGDRYAMIISGLLSCIGIRSSSASALSARGVSLVLALISFAYIIKSSWKNGIAGNRIQENYTYRVTYSLLASSLLSTTFIFIFNDNAYFLYYVPVVILAFPVLALEIEQLKIKSMSCIKKLLIYLTCFAFLFQGGYTSVYLLNHSTSDLDVWSGLYYTDTGTVEKVQDCVDFMLSYNYTHGLINYWYTNVMVELSDAKLCMASLDLSDSRSPDYPILTSHSAFSSEKRPDRLIAFVFPYEYYQFTEKYPDASVVFTGKEIIGLELDTDDYFVNTAAQAQ